MASGNSDLRLRDKLVVLVGGSGFLGFHVAQELLARGARVRIVSRNPERAYKVKTLANLGQFQLLRGNIAKPETIAPLLAGADAVVNLVGAFNGDLDAVQGRGVGQLAASAAAAGAGAFVQVSAIGADAGSAVPYARTKAEGEAAVLAAFPTATIVRPSVMFAQDDRFINLFAGLIEKHSLIPVFGPQAQLQPVFVDDVALAIVDSLIAPEVHGGKTYELAGPEVLTTLDLVKRIAAAQGRKRCIHALSDGLGGLIVGLTGWLPGAPITGDQFKLLKAGNVASGALPGLAAFGITPRPLELFLERWMLQYREHGRFGKAAA